MSAQMWFRSGSRRRILAGGALATLAGIVACTPRLRAGTGAILLANGKIHRADVGRPQAEALVIRDGRIAFVGTTKDASAFAPEARRIDLAGATAFPGFTDSHVHLLGVGLRDLQLDLTGTNGIADLRARLSAHAEKTDGPILGRGWIETHWPEQRFPRAADIANIAAGRPILLIRADGHAGLANQAALDLAGIGPGTADPAGGTILRDASGAADGMLIDNAVDLVARNMPAPDRALKEKALRAALALYARRGWTGAHDMGLGLDDLPILVALDEGGDNPLTIDLYAAADDFEAVFALGPTGRQGAGYALRGVKFYVDGALGSRGAALLAPYADAPGSSGLLVSEPEMLATAFAKARLAGMQIALHAIGDRANRIALDLFEKTFADAPEARRAARWRVEHAQIIAPGDLGRFARLGVIASMQPSHAIGDLYFAPARLGSARLAGAYAWKILADSGAIIAGGSDAPVEKGDPLVEFYAAAFRHDLEGKSGPDWGPEQALPRADALALFTTNAAFASGRETQTGALAPGMVADISVFSRDLMTAPFETIVKAEALLTVSGGRVTHNKLG